MERHLSGAGNAQRHRADMKRFADFWNFWVETAFLKAYLQGVGGRSIIPADASETSFLLDVFLLENLFGDLGESVYCQPEKAGLPLHEVLDLLDNRESGS